MRDGESGSPTLLFAQLNRFSYTNDALERFLRDQLPDFRIETYRVYPAVVKNPILLGLCALAALYFHGPASLRTRRRFMESVVKNPVFFRLASWLMRRRARATKGLRAILQTQGLFNAKLTGAPFLIYTDNTILNRINDVEADGRKANPLVPFERKLYHDADCIAVSATHVVTSLVDDYGVAPSAIRNVLIGANSPPPRDAIAKERYASRKILFVGIDWERKGGPDLLAAFRKLLARVPDATLTIAGAKPDLQGLPRVTALGKIAPEAVSRLMAEAAVYCMPSHIEPSSVAVIEAATTGLPIVATATGGFLDSVMSGETGILVPRGDPDALAEALERLLLDPGLCQRYGDAGRILMRQFQWDVVTAKIAAEIKSRARTAAKEA